MNWRKDSDRRTRNLAAVVVFGGLFSLFGTLVFALLVIMPTWQWLGSLHWQPVPCTITHAQVGSGQTSDLYRADLRYTYTFEGADYEGSRYSFGTIRTSNLSRWQALVDTYPVGSKHRCYVNPEKPEQATLRRFSLGWHWLIPLPLMAVGYGVLYAARTGRIKVGLHGRPADWRPRAIIKGRMPGPIVLSPRRDHIKAFLKIGVVTLAWNSINAMIIQNALVGGAESIFQGITALVLGSFGIIGAVLLYRSARALLCIVSPAIKIELERDLIPVGGSKWLRCYVPGRPGQVTQLAIRLAAYEHAYARNGRGVQKQSALMYEQFLSVQSDEALLSIPTDVMHSLEAEHSKVTWTLEVSAKVEGWLDIKDRYPLTVLPMPIRDRGVKQNETRS